MGKRNPENTKRDLLMAAGSILAEKGLYGFHVHEVAKRAGYGKPLVYRYFGDRHQVLDALALFKVEGAKAELANLKFPENGKIPRPIYTQVMFARLLAGDLVLQALFRAQLSGELGVEAVKALNDLIPTSQKSEDAAAGEAFLLAGISFVLLLREFQPTCAGVPIETPNDLAAFEREFIRLAKALG